MALKILSLDLGQHTGWAGLTGDGEIISGVANFVPKKGERYGKQWFRFKTWLDVTVTALGAPHIYYEVAPVAGAFPHTMRVQGGYLATVTGYAEERAIPYTGINSKTIKKFITGNGNASKDLVIGAVTARGHDPIDDNEADALALLYLAMTQGEFNATHPAARRRARGEQHAFIL